MEFEYYTDEIVLNNKIINNDNEIKPLDDFINSCLNKSNIDFEQSTIFYKRNKKGASILGIQLLEGNNEDISNYIVYDCMPFINNKSIFCNIDVHANAKLSLKAVQFTNNVSNDVSDFFKQMESLILKNNQNDIELDYMKNIFIQKKKQNLFTKILKRF